MSNTSDTTGGSGRWANDREAASRGVEREAQSARTEASHAAGTIRDEASKLVSGARQKAEEQVEHGKSAAASSLEDFTAAIRKASDELGERDQSMAANLVREAASGLEQASEALKGQSLQELTRSVAGFARRQPAAFLIGAALAGVALGRFARASGDHADREHLRGGSARPSDRASASSRSQRTSIPSDGLNHSDPEGAPITRVGSSGFEASRTTGAASRPTGAEFGSSGSSGTTGTEGLAGSSDMTKDFLR